MIINFTAFGNREFWRGHTAYRSGISLNMATDVQVRPIYGLSAAAKGAQCPNCFTFNMPHHLPEHRKQQGSSGMQLTCALCGTRYTAQTPFESSLAPFLNSR